MEPNQSDMFAVFFQMAEHIQDRARGTLEDFYEKFPVTPFWTLHGADEVFQAAAQRHVWQQVVSHLKKKGTVDSILATALENSMTRDPLGSQCTSLMERTTRMVWADVYKALLGLKGVLEASPTLAGPC